MKNLLRRLRSFVSNHKSREIEIIAPMQRKHISGRKPSWRRTETVTRLLDEAPHGSTYEQRIEHVRKVTGKGCSRKVVARWSKQRFGAALMLAAISSGCLQKSAATNSAPIIAIQPDTSQSADTRPVSDNSPRTIKITVTISRAEDLRVKAGDEIKQGDVLADRAQARTALVNQRRQAEITLERLTALAQSRDGNMTRPNLPVASFAEHQANIRRAEVALEAARRAVEIQRQRITQIEGLQFPANLSAVREHEAARLANLEQEERQTAANLELAKAQLETARANRAYTEQRDVLEIRRQEIAQREQRQQLETQVSQTRATIAALDQQIAALAAVRAPFSGTIRRVQWEGQNNAEINVLLTVDVDGGNDERASR